MLNNERNKVVGFIEENKRKKSVKSCVSESQDMELTHFRNVYVW